MALSAAGLLLDTASAHRIDEYLQATLLSVRADRIEGSMRLIPGERVAPSVIGIIDSDRDGQFSAAEQRAYAQRVLADLSISALASTVRPKLVSWTFPPAAQMRQGLGEIRIDYVVDWPPQVGDRTFVLENRHFRDRSVYLVNVIQPKDPGIRIAGQKRNPQQSRYELNYRQERGVSRAVRGPPETSSEPDPSGWARPGTGSMFRLGMRHIAGGTDHLLFLLVLLLPAPVCASVSRWRGTVGVRETLWRVLRIVTAFTVGHSFTLALAALEGLTLPTRPVEVLIGLSILVSALHALRPLYPGREVVVAASFGLVHGLAFAATLDRLGLEPWSRAAATLSFNLGIEAMQCLVVAAVLPSLLLWSRARGYRMLRMAGAAFAGIASSAWIVERLSGLDTHVDGVIDALRPRAPLLAAGLLMIAGACYVWTRRSSRTR